MKHSLKRLILAGSGAIALSVAAPFAFGSTAGATEATATTATTTEQATVVQTQHHNIGEQTEHKTTEHSAPAKTHVTHTKPAQPQAQHTQQQAQHQSHTKQNDQKNSNQNQDHHKRMQYYHWQHKLEHLLREHARLGVAALKAEQQHSSNAQALAHALDANSQAIAWTVNKLYPGTHHKFLHLWRQHIHYYQEYLQAAKHHDMAGMQHAKYKLNMFAWKASNLLNKANWKLDQHKLRYQLMHHGEQVTQIIDYLVAGKYKAAHMLAHKATKHMSGMAHTLAAVVLYKH